VPRSTTSCPSSTSVVRTSSRSRTPRWLNGTATFIRIVTLPGMQGPDLWRELGQQLRVDSVRCAAEAKSGHPTSGMSGAELMAGRKVAARPFRAGVRAGVTAPVEGWQGKAAEPAAYCGLDKLIPILAGHRLVQHGPRQQERHPVVYVARTRTLGPNTIEIA